MNEIRILLLLFMNKKNLISAVHNTRDFVSLKYRLCEHMDIFFQICIPRLKQVV